MVVFIARGWQITTSDTQQESLQEQEEQRRSKRTHKSGEGYREENKGVNGGGVMVVL